MEPKPKHFLTVELGATTNEALQALEMIKHAMSIAIIQKIETTGIQDAQDCDFQAWQSIYLEAHHTAQELTLNSSFAALT